ncbi:glycosyltransferase family 2 protein [Parabacteroides distasonis]|uniref:glycosyltransferase family 2 protein n=1 Tax=Parabacteroides distasonis TaxID=823 RepID=UPI00189CDC5A|nr:glycosyltransferase family 2 protein [Parabacteroides distasonis]MDB9153757.1 glycosyltransferase family 2 protein [Parabacteroides distasonis]MDB9158396.1 glycosyltransferase family 2 protein [Parabacteroides distasonis]MDB9167157.1 glycosyltransferase family 2 protein [Parabacteroides distasonis]MDB9171693.1 glycosyltransferase family 2 protein [Parabacteroides distasonis]MDB9193742.1 glycosyltransferase family 2 protein [Parabacteroides distasonis]
MDSQKLVSIIITTYRRPELLSRAVESVLNQTYKDIEVIVIDDNDPDSTYRVETMQAVAHFNGNNKVRYIKHPYNRRQSAALNTGIECANGYYIGFLDDDDEFLPEKIEAQVSMFESYSNRNDIGGVICNVYRAAGHKHPDATHYTTQQCSRNLIYPMLMSEISYFGSTALVKREVFDKLKGFNENLIRHVDWEFFTRFFNYYTLVLVEEPLVKIYIEGTRNNPQAKRYLKAKEIFFDEVNPYLEIVEPHEREIIYRVHWFDVAISFFSNGCFKNGCEVLKRAMTHGCLCKDEWVLLIKVILKNIFKNTLCKKE